MHEIAMALYEEACGEVLSEPIERHVTQCTPG